jgi:hypothetical protein
VELATALGTEKSGSLIVAAIAAVFTIGYVANLLGEDEDWLHELSIDMFPEDGRLWVYGVGEDGVTAFTEDGSRTCVRSLSTSEPPAVRRHRSNPPNNPSACGEHRRGELFRPSLDSRGSFCSREWQKHWGLIKPSRNCGAKFSEQCQ